MQKNDLVDYLKLSFLFNSQSYIEQLYEEYLKNPNSIGYDWREFFNQLPYFNSIQKEHIHSEEKKYFKFLAKKSNKKISNNQTDSYFNFKKNKVKKMIESFRMNGHKISNVDPLNLLKKEFVPELELFHYKFNKNDLNTKFSSLLKKEIKLKKIFKLLKKIYCKSIGIEYMHISNQKEKQWIQKKIETEKKIHDLFEKKEKINFLKKLIESEGLEKYIGLKFPGAKRFSLEGCDSLIPLLKDLIYNSTNSNIKEIMLGMAHRGRINVLINIFGKKPKDLFNEFLGNIKKYKISGDVKYHQGFSCTYYINKKSIDLHLAFNPSHLEIINPVITGSTKARLEKKKKILPITIHGDAAFIAQGITQETLNISQVPGYSVNGTIRIVINNQIGFTTSNPKHARTTKYCTDIMKMIESPIFHVNADDIESVIFVGRLALEFRNKFKRDVIIDLVCYRRQGHNESDEPRATQPIMYQKIKNHPTISKIYSQTLITTKILNQNEFKTMNDVYRKKLDLGNCVLTECTKKNNENSLWKSNFEHTWKEKYPNKTSENQLKTLAKQISNIPKKIIIQERVKKIYKERALMAKNKKKIDWGFAETLSYATLLDQGINIRLSGEDVSRGTFFHRHAIIHNQKNGEKYIPLQNIHKKQGKFDIIDSVLSEESTLAFEYGYSSTNLKTLTIWEAQFGDFSNVAQVVIDQFITSSEKKWGIVCGLIMLLPHGYEGQGPEHSSARLERYLQLCAEENIQVCVPSTPAQIYHMIRRQILRKIRKPLIVMSPKSLLRHPLATSNLKELTNNNFKTIINEIELINHEKINRIILCSGKIYYELIENRKKYHIKNIAIIRIEQLYPFPNENLKKILKSYQNTKDFIWCQEEPINQGSWIYIKDKIQKILPKNSFLKYSGREESASPAVGYLNLHQIQQNKIIKHALNLTN